MFRKFKLFFSLILFYHFSFAQIDVLKNISNEANTLISSEKLHADNDIANGLTQTLKISVIKSCNKASMVNGFLLNDNIKILFPKEINNVKKACLKLGLSSLVSDFEKKMNKTAELVSNDAARIIVDVVLSLRFNDALKILNGDDNAATIYLKENSSINLYSSLFPNVQNQINNTGVQKKLDLILKKYNRIPLVKKVDFDLADYITLMTIDGIFYLISENEKDIRNNPQARTTELLKKIFK
tara:strand:+ start:132 stop:854 length:723 start_codon:yes stop_codon:yes gene_type:complete